MSIHARYINNALNNRVNINFFRADLLWSCDQIINPHTDKEYKLPIFERTNQLGDRYYKGPNILDLIDKIRLTPELIEQYATSNSESDQRIDNLDDEELYLWRIRPHELLFAHPKVIKKTKKYKPTKRVLDSYPLKSLHCTGGRLVDINELIYEEFKNCKGFTIIEKRSSISISRQIFLLSTALCGDSPERASELAENLARQAWIKDLKRAYKLYTKLQQHPEGIPHWKLPVEVMARCAVSQEVENFLYRKICHKLKVDPDRPLSRNLGRRPKQSKAKKQSR